MPNPVVPVGLPGPLYRALPRDPHTWLVKDLLPKGGWLNIYGAPKTAKSFAALQLAFAVSDPTIDTWLTFPIQTHGPVLYLQLDTARPLWLDRLDDFAAIGFNDAAIIFADKDMVPTPFDVREPAKGGLWLKEACRQHDPVLVIVDVIRELSPANENDSGEMQLVISTLDRLIKPAAAAIISHSKKDNLALPKGERHNLMQDQRGSSYIAGRMDGVMKLTDTKVFYQSRTLDKGELSISQGEYGVVTASPDPFHAAMDIILANPLIPSDLARAEALRQATGEKLERCRTALRRRQKKL